MCVFSIGWERKSHLFALFTETPAALSCSYSNKTKALFAGQQSRNTGLILVYLSSGLQYWSTCLHNYNIYNIGLLLNTYHCINAQMKCEFLCSTCIEVSVSLFIYVCMLWCIHRIDEVSFLALKRTLYYEYDICMMPPLPLEPTYTYQSMHKSSTFFFIYISKI